MSFKKFFFCCKSFDFIEKIIIILFDFLLMIINFNWESPAIQKSIFSVFLTLVFLFSVIRIIKLIREKSKNVFHANDTDGIKNYMEQWLNNDSRVVIVTRDMSWVSENDAIYNILLRKAKKDELTIIVKNSKNIVKQLETQGAKVFQYNNINFTPSVRFTFINYGLSNPRLAIGFKEHDFHKIKEFEKCGAIEYALAEDIFKILEEVGKNESSV